MKKTSGKLKIIRQFEKFSKSSLYRNFLIITRKNLELPEDGLPYNGIEDLKKYKRPSLFPIKKERLEDYIAYHTLEFAKDALTQFPIQNHYLEEVIRYHIIYNKLFFKELSDYEDADIARLDHLENEFAYFGIEDYISADEHNKNVLSIIEDYPISIRISADCSITDIVNYIKSNQGNIKELQEEYKNKDLKYGIKMSKKSSNPIIKKRDKFIWENRKLSYKENCEKTNKKFGGDILIDQGSIGKILSNEKKKRE